jgi:hypothetical protein
LAAVALLGGSIASAHADYVVIIMNLGQQREVQSQPGGPGGMQPGGPGGPGGRTGGPTGERPPVNPGGGPGGRPGGGPGGMPPGGGGLYGGPTVPGGGPMMPPSGQTGDGTVIDPDAVPLYVTAVFEIQNLTQNQHQMFEGDSSKNIGPKIITIKHKWGSTYLGKFQAAKEDSALQVYIVPDKGLNAEFSARLDKAIPKSGKGSAEDVLALADWCLRHGMLTKFTEVMDAFAKDNTSHPAAAAYLQVKNDLARPAKNPSPNPSRTRLLQGFNTLTSDHYLAYHNDRAENPPEVQTRLRRLEDNYRAFYYWFALRGAPLPVPEERLTTVVTFKGKDDFKQLSDALTSSPVISDGFVARRENVTVFAARRLDAQYEALQTATKGMWDEVNKSDFLKTPDGGFKNAKQMDQGQKAYDQTMAILMKVMESDAELAGASHDGTRQLLYASGLLHKNVEAPEWLQFGMGSFFETPLGSLGTAPTAASAEYLPLWRDIKTLAKKEKRQWSPAEILRMVVTDGYFRDAQKNDDVGALRKARATSWALTYYLLQNNKFEGQKDNLERMRAYLKTLAKMPRDLDLDETVLLDTFTKAFGLTTQQKFEAFANEWDKFMDQEPLERKEIVESIRAITAPKIALNADGERVKSNTGGGSDSPYHPKPSGGTGGTTGQPGGGQQYPPGGGQPYPPGGGMGPGGRPGGPTGRPGGGSGQPYPPGVLTFPSALRPLFISISCKINFTSANRYAPTRWIHCMSCTRRTIVERGVGRNPCNPFAGHRRKKWLFPRRGGSVSL